jgi:protein-S-isoprenylcysteine O-methyltransferase Ste14
MNNNVKTWLSLVVRMSLFAVALLWPAGTWQWWEAWVLVAMWTVFGVVITQNLLRHDPALLAERMKLVPLHKEQKAWDKVLMLLFFITAIGLYLIPGFDVVRYEWSEPLPVWMKILAMLVHIPCFLFLGWVMRENTFLSQVVKIDKARDHQVVTTGPYALVRHHVHGSDRFAVCGTCGARIALRVNSCSVSDIVTYYTYLLRGPYPSRGARRLS